MLAQRSKFPYFVIYEINFNRIQSNFVKKFLFHHEPPTTFKIFWNLHRNWSIALEHHTCNFFFKLYSAKVGLRRVSQKGKSIYFSTRGKYVKNKNKSSLLFSFFHKNINASRIVALTDCNFIFQIEGNLTCEWSAIKNSEK